MLKDSHTYRAYGDEFPSRNQLWKHVKERGHNQPLIAHANLAEAGSERQVVRSTQQPVKAKGTEYRTYHYATVNARLIEDGKVEEIYPNIGCQMSLIDKIFLKLHSPHLQILHMANAIPVRGVGNTIHHSADYVITEI